MAIIRHQVALGAKGEALPSPPPQHLLAATILDS
jgi:hypothetical protein